MITCEWLVGEVYEIRVDGILVGTAVGRRVAKIFTEAMEKETA